jgi:hypothetical protein
MDVYKPNHGYAYLYIYIYRYKMRLIWIYIHIYIIIYTYRNHIKSNHGIAMRICHGEILRNLMGWIMMIHWPEKFKFRPWLGIVAPIQFSLQSEFSTLQHTSTTAGSGVAPLTDVVIFTIVVGRKKKLLAWGLLTRLLSDSDTRFDSESVAKDPPQKKTICYKRLAHPEANKRRFL